MISVSKAIQTRDPQFFEKYPKLFTTPLVKTLQTIIHEDEINEFLDSHRDYEGFEFVDAVLKRLEVDYQVSGNDRERIPTKGKVLIIANHPLGGVDGLALLKMVGEIRKDVKIVANELLTQFKPLAPLLLPVDNMGSKSAARSLKGILEALNNEEAVIIFPAGEVSRLKPTGIKDSEWKDGFLKIALKTASPVLPIKVVGKNSPFFYSVSTVFKPISTLFLANELFKQKRKAIKFYVGGVIPVDNLDLAGYTIKQKSKILKKQLMRLGKNKKEIFLSETTIARPEDRQTLKQELKKGKLLGETKDGKKIFLFDYIKDSALIREIGRLREFTFRKVGEGSGEKRDNDKYDKIYRHLILWDDEKLEIVGAYRIGETNSILETGKELYTESLFHYKKEHKESLVDAIELGRSFVQPAFWGSRALDYLWQGIGAYLKHNPHIKTMFGPVSIPANFSSSAKETLVYFYTRYYGSTKSDVTSKNPFTISRNRQKELEEIFTGENYKENFTILRDQLTQMNASVPTLYKQYSELCEDGGVVFSDFGIDPEFGNCIDGFIIVDVRKIKEIKRKRYIGE